MPEPTEVLASFLLPDGFRPPGALALAREATLGAEIGRYAAAALQRRRARPAPYARRSAPRSADPVVLVPGFMAGDASLAVMSGELRRRGYRTYRSHIHANIGCTMDAAEQLEARLESIAVRRGSRVQLVGHSLGGMIARGVAVRRPDLVSGIVTMGSPMLAPGAHHRLLSSSVSMLVRLSRAGWPGLMSEDCVAGECARRSFDDSRAPVSADVAFTAIYSRRDGVVDWRACVDPQAEQVEVSSSHCGMAVDPQVIEQVSEALRRHTAAAGLSRVGAPGPVSGLDVEGVVGA